MIKKLLPSAVIGFGLAYALPVYSGPAVFGAAAFLGSMLLLAVVYARALRRHDELNEWMAIELNKIRRIYHLAKNLGGESRHRQWFTDLHGFVYGYLSGFDKRDFGRYQEGNADFRKLSYHLYTISGLETEKERVLYRDLLEAAGTVAGARQHIQDLWNGGLPASAWKMLAAIHAAAAAALLFSMGPADKLVTALLITVAGVAIAAVREADGMKALASASASKRYVENIARLELRRHEG